jgi:hypothetical protein
MTPGRKNGSPRSAGADVRVQRRRARLNAIALQHCGSAPREECICSFGATRVGPMIERVRLHVTTDRFLANRRGDKMPPAIMPRWLWRGWSLDYDRRFSVHGSARPLVWDARPRADRRARAVRPADVDEAEHGV